MNLFYLTELSLIKKSPHCGSVLREIQDLDVVTEQLKKITLLFQTIRVSPLSTLSSLFPAVI